MTVMIDTLKFARSFEQAGFATPQAEALTAAMAEMNRAALDDLVTKSDLRVATAELKNELKTEIATVNATTRSQILLGLFGSQLFVLAPVIALSKFAHLFA
jgi:hypothetical protein